jgi:hypothetical protein
MQTTFKLRMQSFRLNENQDTVALAAISFGLRRPAADSPRSLTSLTASMLNSRLNLRLCMTHLRLYETPNLGVHQTDSSSNP